jgi:hypothetical protein
LTKNGFLDMAWKFAVAGSMNLTRRAAVLGERIGKQEEGQEHE